MSDFKKKKRAKRISLFAPKKKSKYDAIGFNDNAPTTVRRKKSRKHKSLIPAFVLALLFFVLAVSYFITLALHPAGVFEYISSSYASVGSGSGYPVNISGGKPRYTVGQGDKYFLVAGNTVNCYSDSGKIIAERTHAYSDAVVKAADTRYIIYGQGEKELSVNTYSKELYLCNFSGGIIDACISDSGRFAVATNADGYDSSVAVFSKNNKKIYEWFSADETVNSVALSPSGKALAVSTVKVENGKFISSFYVLKFKSADPLMKKVYTDQVIYRIYPSSENCFSAVFANNIEFLNYNKNTVVSHQSEYSVSMVKKVGNKFVAIRTVAANQDESIVEIYKSNGKLISSFNVNSQVVDFSYSSGKIYVLGISEIFKFGQKGNLLSKGNAEYDSLFIESLSDNTVALIRSSVIEKYTLTKTGD